MALIGFTNTHNQDVYVNPAQVLYVAPFEDEVTVIAFAVIGSGGKPMTLYVRGGVEWVQQKLAGKAARAA